MCRESFQTNEMRNVADTRQARLETTARSLQSLGNYKVVFGMNLPADQLREAIMPQIRLQRSASEVPEKSLLDEKWASSSQTGHCSTHVKSTRSPDAHVALRRALRAHELLDQPSSDPPSPVDSGVSPSSSAFVSPPPDKPIDEHIRS